MDNIIVYLFHLKSRTGRTFSSDFPLAAVIIILIRTAVAERREEIPFRLETLSELNSLLVGDTSAPLLSLDIVAEEYWSS